MPKLAMNQPTVAVIGSFRQHYSAVLDAIAAFRGEGWTVLSPAGSDVMDPSADFVRFTTDPAQLSDAEIQAVTLERIFDAQLAYVVAPSGYVGRTTCYEIGRLFQARRPVAFSERPNDVPIMIPDRFIGIPETIAREFSTSNATWIYHGATGFVAESERRLTDG